MTLPQLSYYLIASLTLALYADFFGLELLLTLAAVVAAKKLPRFGDHFFSRIEAAGRRLAERKVAAPLALAAAAFLLRVAMLPFVPVPHPVIADEFSHLLLADTLAHGRLTNPAHVLWRSFETLHVIQLPTYNSMYFPGPALLLLIGKELAGLPWFGLLLGSSALCGLTCWALQAWFPARWAFLGGVLVLLRIGLTSYWVNSYWGGAFTAIGSALVLGAFPRLQRRPSVGLSVVMAIGIGMIANSRPYEGAIFCIPIAVRLFGWLFDRRNAPLASKVWRCVVPMAICLAVIGAGMGVYFAAVTGSPTLLPYVVNQQRYGWPMTLPWTEVKFVKHARKEFADYFNYELGERLYFVSWAGFVGGTSIKLQQDWRFYIGPALTIPFLFIRRIYRSRRLRLLMLTGGVVIFATFMEPHFPHYMAPAMIPIVAALVQGYRYLRLYQRDEGEFGLRLSRAIPVILLVVVGLRVAAAPLHIPYQGWASYSSWCCSNAGDVDQESVVRRLPSGAQHLIFVRYHYNHLWMREWVFNGADIDHSRVVWARELGGDQDRKVLKYFKNRQIWIWEPDSEPPKLSPYQPPKE